MLGVKCKIMTSSVRGRVWGGSPLDRLVPFVFFGGTAWERRWYDTEWICKHRHERNALNDITF